MFLSSCSLSFGAFILALLNCYFAIFTDKVDAII